MKTTKTSAEKIEALIARNARADLIEVATEVLGLSTKTASGLPLDLLVARFARDGFDEENLLQDLVDEYGYHPMGVNELCLSSMIALWIEAVQGASTAYAAKQKKASRKVAKVVKLADFPDAGQLFGQKEMAIISVKSTTSRAAREQDMREVGAWQHKYAMPGQGPRDIIFAMIQAGKFTKGEVRAAVLVAFPAIKGSYLNTMMARTTNSNAPAFKQVAVSDIETGILTWA